MSDLIDRGDVLGVISCFFEDSFIEDADVHCADLEREINRIQAAPRWVRLIGPFDVIDRTTGKYPDLEHIALNEDWAKRLIYCDMEGFAMLEDGNLILLDECGNYEYCSSDRFEAVISTEPPKEGE